MRRSGSRYWISTSSQRGSVQAQMPLTFWKNRWERIRGVVDNSPAHHHGGGATPIHIESLVGVCSGHGKIGKLVGHEIRQFLQAHADAVARLATIHRNQEQGLPVVRVAYGGAGIAIHGKTVIQMFPFVFYRDAPIANYPGAAANRFLQIPSGGRQTKRKLFGFAW